MMDSISGPPFLDITKDVYNSFHISITGQFEDKEFLRFISDFTQKQMELNKDRPIETEITAIWINLIHPKLHLVSALIEAGFQIHNGINKKITVNKWIAKRKNLIPAFSVFYIACGAILIQDECIFLVQEKTGERKGKFGLPSGRADPGETIAECVQRQLRQEANIKAKFKYVMNFRESTNSLYDTVDIYFPCYLELEENGLDNLKICEREIKSYKWVPLSQYEEFTKQNSNNTQVVIAKHITRIWKKGFDFKNHMPNRTDFGTEKIRGTEKYRKFIFHELALEKE